jgi:hypothetical protein
MVLGPVPFPPIENRTINKEGKRDAPHALQSILRVTGCRRQLDVSVVPQWVHSRGSSPVTDARCRRRTGRLVPFSFLYCPQAEHSTACVSGSRRQLLVVVVPQLEHTLPPLPPAGGGRGGQAGGTGHTQSILE